MTLFLMTGTPGSGKSLHMAANLRWRIRRHKPTIANFEINSESDDFVFRENKDLTPDFLISFAEVYFRDHKFHEGEIQLYIDECQLMFNARSWNEQGRSDWIRFFTQHRKLGYDVYLIAQFDNMVDKQIRSLIEYEIKHRKLNNFGWVGKFFHVVAFGRPVVACVTYWYPMHQRTGSEFLLGKRALYRMYDTTKIFSS